MRADDVFEALLRVEEEPATAAEALALAESLAAPKARVRLTAKLAPAGRSVELLPPPKRGSPRLAPAIERLGDVSVYRTLGEGKIEGRVVPAGAKVIVSRRFPQPGELAVVKTRRELCLVRTGPGGAVPLPPDGRFVGAVEGIVEGG